MYNQLFQPQNQYPRYQMPMQNGITWVQGVEGAKAYQLAPNSNALLMDSEQDGRFFIKVSDNVGMCTLREFRFEETTMQKPNDDVDLSQFVTRDELNEILSKRGGKYEKSTVSATTNTTNIKQSNNADS